MDSREGNSTATTLYRILQSPAPVCMFYFAHPFGISSPAGASSPGKVVPPRVSNLEPSRKPVPLPAPKYDRQPSKTDIVRQRPESRDEPKKTGPHGVALRRGEKSTPKPIRPENRTKSKKIKTGGGTSGQTGTAEVKSQAAILTVKPYAKSKRRQNAIELESRQIPLTKWPSTIWNRDFLIPLLLQVLAKQHGRKIPDIEQILRTVRTAWNTPKSQRSVLHSQDSRDSFSSSWDLSSSCDRHYCDQGHYHACEMGAGTYASVMGSGPGLLRRRYSVPEIIMRKHTLAQQKSYDEPHDTNHNSISMSNKNYYCPSPCYSQTPPTPQYQQQQESPHRRGGPMTRARSRESPAGSRKQPESPLAAPALVQRKSITRAANSLEAAPSSNGNHFQTLASTGSESNLVTMSRRQTSLGGISRSQKCSSVIGINSSTNNNNNNYIGPVGSNGVVNGVGAGALGGGCVLGAGAAADFSMRKSTLLRRMWSKEMRRYDRSGSWSPPLRRTPRRIYSIESIIPPEGLAGDGSGASSEGGSSSVTTSTTSCKECAKLESQYASNARSGKLIEESPKRLRLVTSVRNNNLQNESDNGEKVSEISSPGRNLVSSEGLVENSVDSKSEISNNALLRRREGLVNGRNRRNCVFMNGLQDNATGITNDIELDEADLSSSASSSIVSQDCARPSGPAGSTGVILEGSEESALIDNEQEVDPDEEASSTNLNVQDNESDLSEFLKEEAYARKDNAGETYREIAAQRGGDIDTDVHPGKRAEIIASSAPPGASAVKVSEKLSNGEHFPLKKQIVRRSSNASSSAVSISGESTDSESVRNGTNEKCVREANELTALTGGDYLKKDEQLDEYISNLLVDNLNNLLDTKEVFANSAAEWTASGDLTNNNQQGEKGQMYDQGDSKLVNGHEMKHKLPEKYINGGGGVVCNSPLSRHYKENEKENEDSVNNNSMEGGGKLAINYIRKKNGEKKHNANGFYLVPKNGSRESDGPSEIDLNGKYYFPAYGLETDPSDHTDIASEPEMQIISKIGTGSTYRGNANSRSIIVSRISAFPRTESMEVQPSNTSAEEEFDDLLGNNGSDSDTTSLVDSLDEVEITPRRRHDRKKSLTQPPAAAESTTKSETTLSEKSPRHEKGEAFFVPIQDTAVIIDEHIVVADTMPLLIKERLNSRHRMMVWKREQENQKRHRKMMRKIEQKKFYGEPAIQVISTIDRALGRKEHIAPEDKKRIFGQTSGSYAARLPKAKKKTNALRTELGLLESYKIDARGNMQIQNPAAGGAGSSESTSSAKKATKSPWGQAAERRQARTSVEIPPASTKSSGRSVTATTTASSKTPRKTPIETKRKQVLKDVQHMTLYQQADLTPDIEGGPRRMYQKTEIQEGDTHIEILEIVECGDSAPRSSVSRNRQRAKSAGSRSGPKRSRIPVPIYRWGRNRRSNNSRENSPLSTAGGTPKVDRMIADYLLEALSNPDDVGVTFIQTPEELKEKGKRSPSVRKNAPPNSSTPKRSANSGKYTQRFEVIPEERSSVSIGSSSEELSAGKKKHSSPRRVSFDEHHKILNVDEFEPSKLAPKAVVSPRPSPKQSPKKAGPTPAATLSPKAPALKKNTTISRGKAAIQSDVVEEKGWIGFSTQHEDLATPVGDEKDEEVEHIPLAEKKALNANGHHHHLSSPVTPKHDRNSIVKTIITGNIARHDSDSKPKRHQDTNSVSTRLQTVDHVHHHHQSVNISVNHSDSVPVVSVDHVRSTVATVGSNSSCNGTAGSDSLVSVFGRSIRSGTVNHLAIATATPGSRKLTSGEFSDESCFTDSLNGKPSPKRQTDLPDLRELSIPVQLEQDLKSSRHGGHSINELKSSNESVREVNVANSCDCSESLYPYRQIREENAWHVYETTDCKVIQSKIEYYETSIHRTPLTENHSNMFGHLEERTPDSLRATIIKNKLDNNALVRHELKPEDRTYLTSSDTVDCLHIPSIHACRPLATSEDPPKTADTCSSCCFCNPEIHKNSFKPSEGCFYCQAKAQTPSKSFPNPPTPPNIQMSPVPPSPKTPIMELTPTPTLQEIPLLPRKPSQPEKPQENPKPSPTSPKHDPKPTPVTTNSGVQTTDTSGTSTGSTSINGLYTETTKKTDHTHTKTKTKASDTVSTKCTTTNEKIKRSYVPSAAESDKLEEISKNSSTRKKSENTVLNRPKNINNLNRSAATVHSVQKEVKNELKTPIKVLPKTAKELSNRKERERKIDLNLPLETHDLPPKQNAPKAKTTLGFENLAKTLGGSTQSYDETTSSSSSMDSSPNSSPFKKCAAALPPAARWKHNSERNLTQLTMQKITTASKWGNKWRKAARQHEHSPAPENVCLSPARRIPPAGDEPPAQLAMDRVVNGASLTASSAITAASTTNAAPAIVPSLVGGTSQSMATNQGWTVTVAGNYNPDMAPDVEMRLSFPKQPNSASTSKPIVSGVTASSKRTNNSTIDSTLNGHDSSYQSRGGSSKRYIEDAHHIPGRNGQNYTLLDNDSYGGSQGASRAALPPTNGLNPKRSLSRSDGIGGKEHRLPNVGPLSNVPARQNTKKAVKQTMECSVVTSATSKTIANKYHMLSHQQQLLHEQTRYQQPHQLNTSSSQHLHHHSQHQPGAPATTELHNGVGGNRGTRRQRTMSIQSLHHQTSTLHNGGGVGSKFASSNLHHQTRYHDPSSLGNGLNAYNNGYRRVSLESIYSGPHLDNLSVMGNAIAPEHKPRVPTMSERDLKRKHHPCYVRTQPYFS
ncbi:uncharacterized protein LOC129731420 isoform X2 [Wyeomyia smithii]|uniref:uncharacterized protein LOC129731420 isoform X2 n=1 Tax=Wyeomyia smithii TaxID=174621 RepID=UPI002467CA9E|nr:uncharacterized protein LOC129731420 isoform X2 [Wyeomyia smithii]